MFFAYNNGITATAESIETVASPNGLLLTGMRNFQIVNGGQTTASIHAALRNREVDLDRVFVQMKLSIVNSDRALEIVPKISEYANTQNRVSAADFFSNHPFHIRMEGFSRRLYAPSRDGTFRQSKWFYERARGQYQDGRGRLTQAERRRFDLEYPKPQMFTKTDLAKFLNVWRDQPDVVSRGAQKNFADFASFIGGEWNKHSNDFNEVYYREAIAKAIVFRSVEVPESLREASGNAKGFDHGPHALVTIRNDLAHAEMKKGILSFEAYRQARELGLWYIELLLLELFETRRPAGSAGYAPGPRI